MKTFHQFMEQISPQQAQINAAKITAKSLEARQHNTYARRHNIHIAKHNQQTAELEKKNMENMKG